MTFLALVIKNYLSYLYVSIDTTLNSAVQNKKQLVSSTVGLQKLLETMSTAHISVFLGSLHH